MIVRRKRNAKRAVLRAVRGSSHVIVLERERGCGGACASIHDDSRVDSHAGRNNGSGHLIGDRDGRYAASEHADDARVDSAAF